MSKNQPGFRIETQSLILRDLQLSDADDLFEMDADPEVQRYLEKQDLRSAEDLKPIMAMIQKQYRDNGIGRWAIEHKESGECLGWAGLKLHPELNGLKQVYELGYRLKRKHWGKGYATEASEAALRYGFSVLNQNVLYALTHPENLASKAVLFKLGFRSGGLTEVDGETCDWFELTRRDWLIKASV